MILTIKVIWEEGEDKGVIQEIENIGAIQGKINIEVIQEKENMENILKTEVSQAVLQKIHKEIDPMIGLLVFTEIEAKVYNNKDHLQILFKNNKE